MQQRFRPYPARARSRLLVCASPEPPSISGLPFFNAPSTTLTLPSPLPPPTISNRNIPTLLFPSTFHPPEFRNSR